MTTNTAVVTDKAPGAGAPYSQGVSSASMLYVSGQTGTNPETKTLAEGLEAQAEQTLKNLGAVLAAGGFDYSDCVKCTVLLTDMDNFARVNKVYLTYFTSKPLPSRMCYAVKALPGGALVEIDAIASK